MTATERHGTAPGLLRRSLRADGWGTGVFGIVMLLGGPWLSGPLGVPGSWFVPVGVAMLGGAVVLLLLASRPRITVAWGGAVAAVNAVSGVVMLGVAALGVLPLTVLGTLFVYGGVVWVLAFAVLTFLGLRRRE